MPKSEKKKGKANKQQKSSTKRDNGACVKTLVDMYAKIPGAHVKACLRLTAVRWLYV